MKQCGDQRVSTFYSGKCWALGAGLIGLLMSPLATAHPHGWIDFSIRVMTDEEGVVRGLHHAWRMDPFYSLVVFEELQHVDGVSLEVGLDRLGTEIRDNLARSALLYRRSSGWRAVGIGRGNRIHGQGA